MTTFLFIYIYIYIYIYKKIVIMPAEFTTSLCSHLCKHFASVNEYYFFDLIFFIICLMSYQVYIHFTANIS